MLASHLQLIWIEVTKETKEAKYDAGKVFASLEWLFVGEPTSPTRNTPLHI